MTHPLAFEKTDEELFVESATARALNGAAAAQQSFRAAQVAAEQHAAEEDATAAYLKRLTQKPS